jgi:Zn-dependent M28 family amino/carboxypeptidase
LESTINQYKGYFTHPSLGFRTQGNTNTGTVFISPAMAAEMLGVSERQLEKIQRRISRRGKSSADRIDAGVVSMKAERTEEVVVTENVLGYMEGTDKKDELIVITAHYDHEGIKDGEIYNGADDDGSGTVAVLEMAEAFAEAKGAGFAPRRSILFMTVTAEEKGLLGSEYYTVNPVFPLQNTIVNLNIDMIGRVDKANEANPDYIYVIGADKLSSELHKINEEANQKYTKLKLDYTYNDPNDPNRFYYRSDHYNFAKNRIPVAFYFNGVHDDYHRPTDDVEKINFQKMEKISRLVFHTAWELANREQRIVVDSNKQ